MNKMKKTSAAIMAAAVLAVAAPTVGLMPATTAYATETTAKNGIIVKTNAEFFKAKEPYEGAELREYPYYNDWKHTFEISCSEDAFNSNENHEYTLWYTVWGNEGMDAVAEIAWNCDATLEYDAGYVGGTYYPETQIWEGSRGWGGLLPTISILDGDISPFLVDYDGVITPSDKVPDNFPEIFEDDGRTLKYHLGSKNGVDYIGAGNGVFVTPKYGIETVREDGSVSLVAGHFTIEFNQPGTITLTMKDRIGTTQPITPTDPTVNTKEQSFHDETNNIIVEGNFPEGIKLETKVLLESATRNSYDITLLDENGNKVQPNGSATVKLPLPESWKGKDVFVYNIENGKYIHFDSTIEGDYIVFKTNHFSEYMLTTEKIEEEADSNPNTGVSAAAAFGVIALAGAFAIVSRKKR